MSDVLPEALKDEFTQDEWNSLTDEERAGIIADGADDGNPTEDELKRQQEEERRQEEEALAAAAANKTPAKTEEELEAEAAAAAAAAGTDKTEEQKQQEAAAAAAAKQDDKPQETQAQLAPRPRGVVDATLPEDFDAKVKANDDAMTALVKRYDDGDMTFTEFYAEQRRLERESRDLERLKDRAELARESSQQALINHWDSLINPFLAAHPELAEDDVTKAAIDTYLKQTTGPVMAAGGMPGQAEIDKAYEMWCKRFGFKPTGQQQTTAAERKENKVPPTLAGLPSATATNVEDGKLAAISRLTGVEYEEALAKLTPAELEQISKYA